MSPKTPHTAFRLAPETREQLTRIAEEYQTNMSGAVRKATSAFAGMVAAMKAAEVRESGRYPFEAYTAALMGYRASLGLEPGEVIDQATASAIDAAVMGAIPYIREEQHYETLRDVAIRLEGFGVDPDVVAHFRALRVARTDPTAP